MAPTNCAQTNQTYAQIACTNCTLLWTLIKIYDSIRVCQFTHVQSSTMDMKWWTRQEAMFSCGFRSTKLYFSQWDIWLLKLLADMCTDLFASASTSMIDATDRPTERSFASLSRATTLIAIHRFCTVSIFVSRTISISNVWSTSTRTRCKINVCNVHQFSGKSMNNQLLPGMASYALRSCFALIANDVSVLRTSAPPTL